MPRLYLETYGCQMNVADTELIAGALGRDGYESTDDPAQALATLEQELAAWSDEFAAKPRIIVFSKADLLPPGEAEARASAFGALALSAAAGRGLDAFRERVWAALDAAAAERQA